LLTRRNENVSRKDGSQGRGPSREDGGHARWKPWRKEIGLNREVTDACPEKSKVGLEEMDAAVVTFEERSDKMEVADLVETSEATGAMVDRNSIIKR
jgi:hypothetical protein